VQEYNKNARVIVDRGLLPASLIFMKAAGFWKWAQDGGLFAI